MPEGALSGVKVLDLTHYIAGPYCTRFLAGMGAEVVKIEPPSVGEGGRRLGPFPGDIPDPERSGLFHFLNANKKGITLNLKNPRGVQMFRELVKWADLVVESFSPRVMPSLGLGYEALAEINPSLVMTSISSFGQTGPYRDYKATEIVEYALSGLMYITGEPDKEPLKLGTAQAQIRGGMEAFTAALVALYWREGTGQGQHVDVSIMDVCAGLLEFQLSWYAYGGTIAGRVGNINPKGHPGGLFPCKDGHVALSGGHNWENFAKLTGKPELGDPRFATPLGRQQYQADLDATLIPWLMEHNAEEIYHSAQALGIAAGFVRTGEDIYRCEQMQGRDFFVEADHPKAGLCTYPGAPYTLQDTPWQVGSAPLLGEHNEQVYCGLLGYDRDDLVKLRKAGVI